MVVAERDQVARVVLEIDHRLVAARKTRPPDHGVETRRIAPLLFLEDLLSHEQHGNAGPGQHQAHREPAAAARIPGAAVAAVSELRHPGLAPDIDLVVVLDMLDPAPARAERLTGDGV